MHPEALSIADYVVTNLAELGFMRPTLTVPTTRQRKDTQTPPTDEQGYQKYLGSLWAAVKAEAKTFQNFYPEQEYVSQSIRLSNGKKFTVFITDAASGHTRKTFESYHRRRMEVHSGMMMIWFGIEDDNGNLVFDQDKFFSNPALLNAFINDKSDAEAISSLIQNAIYSAVKLLQKVFNLDDAQLKDYIDINISSGCRFFLELLNSHPPGSQSGPLGHLTVTIHPLEEQLHEHLPKEHCSDEEIIKLADPWLQIINMQFPKILGRMMENISTGLMRDLRLTDKCSISINQNGIEIKSANGMNISDLYAIAGAIYNKLEKIRRGLYDLFIAQYRESDLSSHKEFLIRQFSRCGVTDTQEIHEIIHFILNLEPTRPILLSLLHLVDAPDILKHVQDSLEASERHHKNNNQQGRFSEYHHNTMAIYGKLVKLQQGMSTLTTEEELEYQELQRQLTHRRKLELKRKIYQQRLLITEIDASGKVTPAVITGLPTHRLSMVTSIDKFTIDADTNNILVKKAFIALSFSGQGPYELGYEANIRRSRPA